MKQPLNFCFTAVRFYNEPFGGVAFTNYDTAELYINTWMWNRLSEEHQVFVLCHEEGHIIEGSSNEDAADSYASNKYLNAGYSITESVTALTQVLNDSNTAHRQRAYNQLQRAIRFNNKKQYHV